MKKQRDQDEQQVKVTDMYTSIFFLVKKNVRSNLEKQMKEENKRDTREEGARPTNKKC